MDADLGTIIHRMQKRQDRRKKWNLRDELLDYRDAAEVKKNCPSTWKDVLWEQLGLKKSSLFSGIQVNSEFSPLLLVRVDGVDGDDGWVVEPEFASIPSSSLKLLLKVAKGTADDVKEEYLRIAASLSFTDFKKYVAEKEGKEVCDCTGRPVQKIVWCCPDCGKRVKSEEPGGDS